MYKINKKITNFIIILTIIIISLSLLSYNYTDKSFILDKLDSEPPKNILGSLGANIAGILLYYFGCSALYIILLLILLLYLINVKNNNIIINNIDRISALIILVFLLCMLFNIIDYEIFKNVYPGGFIGFKINSILLSIFEKDNLAIFILLLLWIDIIIIDQFKSSKIFKPITILLSKIPFKYLKIFSDKLFKVYSYFYKDELEQENENIYDDPFWTLYSKKNNKNIK